MTKYICYFILYKDGSQQFFRNRESLERLNKHMIRNVYEMLNDVTVFDICDFIGSGYQETTNIKILKKGDG